MAVNYRDVIFSLALNRNSLRTYTFCTVKSIILYCNYFIFFIISNGVRQGGILSPKLFSVYIDELANLLNN